MRTHHISSGIYYCKHCKFDVCNNCPDFLNINRKCPKCNEKIHHFHALTDPINGNYTCYKCENQALDINGVYSCENCGFLMCPTCEKKDRNVILFDKLQSNSRKNTPLKKNHLDELSSSNKSPNLFEKVKKSGFISDNTVNPLNQDIKNEDLITFSNKHTDNFYPNQYLKETYPELKKIDIKPLISEKLDKTPILTPLIEIKSPIYKEKSEKSEYNYNKIAPPMLLEPAEKIYTPIKQEIFNKPLDNLKFTAKETSFITKTQGVYDNNYPDPNPFEKDYQYSHPFQKI